MQVEPKRKGLSISADMDWAWPGNNNLNLSYKKHHETKISAEEKIMRQTLYCYPAGWLMPSAWMLL